jgi:ribonuclease HI
MIKQALQHHAIINTASDGSYDPGSGIMSYGWVVAINETIIAEGKGPAEGHQKFAQSFRAEAYGLASATGFIQTMSHHFQLKNDDHKWFFHIDNKSLVKRMESYQSEKITSKWALLPDIDVTNMAHTNTEGLNAQFRHVKGHQNRKADQKLDFPAQLNIKADGLADKQ